MQDDILLSVGTRLGEFEILGPVGVGGFGIVYRAFDHDLEREVAIKEYMPSALASRDGATGAVHPRSQSQAETFDIGRRSFMMEAKMLARFDHPALVKVFRYWEGNGTAYMVMPLYHGQTLAQVLKQMASPPGEAWLMGVLVPLLGALEVLHSQQIFHRDVSPDNVLLLPNGRPVLLDFGAARQVITDRTQTLTAILKPNYAPIEQYAEVPSLKQGPWTDLYALGAVVYCSLSGKPPPPAVARAVQDGLVPLSMVAESLAAQHGLHYSPAFLEAWQQALRVLPQDRPQSVAALMQCLGLVPAPGVEGQGAGAAFSAGHAVTDDWTVVATGQRYTLHPGIAPAAMPVATPVPTAVPVSTAGHSVVAAVHPATTAQPTASRTTATRTTAMSSGRDMRPVPPGATQATSGPTLAAAAVPVATPTTALPDGEVTVVTASVGAPSVAPPVPPAPSAPPATVASPGGSPRVAGNTAVWAGAGLGALALLVGAFFLGRGHSAAPVAPTVPVPPGASAPAAPAVPAAPVSAPVSAPVRAASRPEPEIITEYPDPPASAVKTAPKTPPTPPTTPEVRQSREPKDGRDSREGRESRERDVRDVRESREAKDPKETRDIKESREPKEPRGRDKGSGGGSPSAKARCESLLQRASLGDPLNDAEQIELRSQCN